MPVKTPRSKMAKEYAEAILETVREPLVVLSSDLRVLTANRSFYKIFRVTKSETANRFIHELGNEQWNQPKLLQLLNDIITRDSFFQDYELEHDFPTIGKRVVLLNGRRIIQKSEKEPMILLAIEDITEKKQLERQKDDFISIASHELKTPVTSMKIYAQMLQKHPLLTRDKHASEMLAKMDEQMNRLTGLVASFMSVYQLGTKELRFHKKHFALEMLIGEVVSNFQYTVRSHTVELKSKTKVQVFADRDLINQVLVNIISNAIKYSPDSKKVYVKLAKDTKKTTVSIQDFGMGIPKDEQQRIYERFFRAKGKREGKIPGLGLGLFISSEIVRQHGGQIWENSIEGKGSTFHFSLPLSKKKSHTPLKK
jgi:PAS domain S-box-containing protein